MKTFIINPYALIHPGERPSRSAWLHFALIYFMAVGTGLLLSGIIFFFAYNWENIPYLVKLTTEGTAIAALAIGAMLCNERPLARQMLLLGASVLVGVMLAVYGQAYHLQSNSGFLAWALFIVLWCIVADFDVLWLVFITVLQTGIFIVVGEYKSEITYMHLTFLVLIGIFAFLSLYWEQIRERSRWFVAVLFSASAVTAMVGEVSHYDEAMSLFYLATFLPVAVLYGFRKRHLGVMSLGFLVTVVEFHVLFYKLLVFLGAISIIVSILAYVWFLKKLKQKWNTSATTPTNTNENGNTE